MFKNLAAIPSIVGYRKIILLGRTRSYDVAKRHLTIYIIDLPTMSSDDRTTLCNGRAMVEC